MTVKKALSIALINFFHILAVSSQVVPFVYSAENTGYDCPVSSMAPFNELTAVYELTDPLRLPEGRRRVSTLEEWRCRRAEIGTIIQHYLLGKKPAPPVKLKADFSSDGMLTVIVYENNDSLILTSKVTLPQGSGPFPVVIGVGSSTGSLPADIFTARGVATVWFNFAEVMAWKPARGKEPFNRLYPDTTVGSFAAWAWGISRIIDGLERVPAAKINLKRIAVTGCSFAGKIALYAGAFDERIALTITQESGGGGAAAWRVTETLEGKRETLRNAQGVPWYSSNLRQFDNEVSKLPFDQHELMAMVAPRALLVLGNPDYEWLADESGYVSCMAAKEVWKTFGVPDRFGFSIVAGHPHCRLPDSQSPEVIAFIEKFLLGRLDVNTNVSVTPYNTDLSRWIRW